MQKCSLVLDGHVHVYPHYNLETAIQLGTSNLHSGLKNTNIKGGKNVHTVWLLTERFDCNFFKTVYDSPQNHTINGYNFVPSAEKEALMIEQKGAITHFILAGRQVVSKDGLEVLALATAEFIKDREYTTEELIDKVNEVGGIPVLNWAPGKWFFQRGKIVAELIEKKKPEEFVIGDNPLRHSLWPEPALMKKAMNKGFKVIAGSDPLPFKGEERFIGSYGFHIQGKFDATKPATSIRQLVKNSQKTVEILGKRNDPFTFFYREARIMAKK